MLLLNSVIVKLEHHQTKKTYFNHVPVYLMFLSEWQDYDNVEEVNRQLEKMGFNIGVRIVEDFLARTNSGKCTDLR
jgi:hypothetical protein